MMNRIGFSGRSLTLVVACVGLFAGCTLNQATAEAPGQASTADKPSSAPDRFPGVIISKDRTTPEGQRPDRSPGLAQFPDADAINLLWEQTWTINEDGSFVCRNNRWFKFLNSRPIRNYADPRVKYNTKYASLKINKAETILPDGSTIAVPDYSFIPVATDAVAGWPAWIDWRELVICFSGIENDAVQHLDYEITFKQGYLPWVDADLRLNDEYPTIKRIVKVTIPALDTAGITVHLEGPDSDSLRPKAEEKDGFKSFTWNMVNIAAAPSEPQCPAWQKRCNRLRFTSCFQPGYWAGYLIDAVAKSAVFDSKAIQDWVKETTEDTAGQRARALKIADTLRKSVTIVDTPMAWASLENTRPASDVFDSAYANPVEAAALLLCALQAAGIQSAPCPSVNEFNSGANTPTNSVFSGILLMTKVGSEVIYIHPQEGEVTSPGAWGNHTAYPPTGEGWQNLVQLGKIAKNVQGMLKKQKEDGLKVKPAQADVSGVVQPENAIPFAARGEAVTSHLEMSGTIKLDEETKAEGEIRIRLTGLFYDPQQADSSGLQKRLASTYINHVLSDFSIDSCSVQKLSGEECILVAKVHTEDPLPNTGDVTVLSLGDGPAFLAKVPMPLGRSYRSLDVELAGAFEEAIELIIQYPEDYDAIIVPSAKGDNTIGQVIRKEENQLHFLRRVSIPQNRLTPEQFAETRTRINNLRTDTALTTGFKKVEKLTEADTEQK